MKTLVIVDFQRDFANNKGALYVPGAENAEQKIISYINNNHSDISDVIFTIDWHSPNHCSFKNNGGMWPNHCVQYTEGAGIVTDLMNICLYYNLPIKIFKKGNVDNIEEYGAFHEIEKYEEGDNMDIVTTNIAGDDTIIFENKDVVVCGLAGDYCVKTTIDNLLQCEDLNVSAFIDGIASIDGGKTFDQFVKDMNLKIERV